MCSTKRLVLLLSIILCYTAYSQEEFEGLGESEFALNHRFNPDYKLNFSIRSRYFMYRNKNFNFENRQLDFIHFSTINFDYYHSLSLGIQFRVRESIDGGSNELRLTQQFNYTKTNESFRFGHRLRLEQRIFDDLTALRLRYRFAIDTPLNGEKLNIGESYFLTAMEALLSLANAIKPQMGHRTTAQIGWLLSEKSKIQIGLEYRFEAFNITTEEKLFLLSSFILKI
ncbi:DUF2490 domain-containing protein [Winogradskyella alexanderae]|uniref:DUF2490 domain-containing protein n=1 Tax=Winogradskyella alexanderae TaxID=2877123 RepID=A0ABS7XM22_9FLAO|nr:DUF2490 domain-containing protein [Winogradskyella alexanderae]MCA0131050.1 DUF2490 domain-containing protein [Winogradskyella alexanderae]